jgi:hypothetical protein
MGSPKAWCGTCRKETSRYARSGGCRSCQARENGLTTYAKHGDPLTRSTTSEQRRENGRKGGLTADARHGNPGTLGGRRKGGLARIEKHGNPIHNMTPEGAERHHYGTMAGGYRSGRVRLGKAIDRKQALVAELGRCRG